MSIMKEPEELASYFKKLLEEAETLPRGVSTTQIDRYSDDVALVSRIYFESTKHVRIAGWMATPRRGSPRAVVIQFPEYAEVPFPPILYPSLGIIGVVVAVRGYEGSDATVRPGFPGLLVSGLPDPNTYIYRDIVIDCVRGLLEVQRLTGGNIPIVAAGRSQGAALSLILAALCPGIHAVTVEVPWLCDIEAAIEATDSFPYRELHGYLAEHPADAARARATLRLFDVCNHASRVQCPVLIGIGTSDPVTPIASTRKLASLLPLATVHEYEGAGHEGGGLTHRKLQAAWIQEQLPA